MQFLDSREVLLSKEDFIALDDHAKLEYFATHLPVFEKKILHGMISGDKDKIGVNNDNATNAFTCVANCYSEDKDNFDVAKFQCSIAKLVVNKAVTLANAVWTELFAYLSTEQAKLIVKRGIANMLEANPDLDVSGTSLTYGEVDFFSFANILERANPQLDDKFVDLGHGTGKGMICANLLYGNLLKKCYGVEIIPELYEASVAVLDQFRKKVLNLDTSGGAVAAGGGGATEQEDCCLYAANRSCEMEVALGDILVEEFIAEWTSADIVFANSTCFDDSLMRQLGDIAGERMKVGSRFITLTKQVSSPKFKLLDRRQYVMSWGEATCFTMLRVADE